MWKQWVQAPHTKGQSSPGNLQSGQHPSNATRQIPQVSSLAIHFHVATLFHPRILTLNLVLDSAVSNSGFLSASGLDASRSLIARKKVERNLRKIQNKTFEKEETDLLDSFYVAQSEKV